MLTVVKHETAYLKDSIAENAAHIFAHEHIGKQIANMYLLETA
jgi:hypothetical protein